jgi:SAM-dependent methyltransferase
MTFSQFDDSVRYLTAKKSVDDRALNRHVTERLAACLNGGRKQGSPIILEVGAGIGTMLERFLERGFLQRASYDAIDILPCLMAEARHRISACARHLGLDVDCAERIHIRGSGVDVDVGFEAIDVYNAVQDRASRPPVDLVVANAFLDLVDAPRLLPGLLALLRPGGYFWFTLNFDGLTILEPSLEPGFDEDVIALYHDSMDRRVVDGRPSGSSRTGRSLFRWLRDAGATILDAGSSDWVVFPAAGCYPGDEAYFLHYLIETMARALEGHPSLDPDRFSLWIAGRHSQVERGELVLIAHQLDLLGQRQAVG